MTGLSRQPNPARTRAMHRQSNRAGTVVVMFVFCLPVLIILAGLAINIAYIQVVRTEIQIVNDATARAATRAFASTGSMSEALLAAQRMADVNQVNYSNLTVQMSDLEPGYAERSSISQRYSFTPGTGSVNAIRVNLGKTPTSASGPVRLLFPNLAGSGFVSVSGSAIATQVELDLALVIDRSGSMAYAANEIADGISRPAAAPFWWWFNGPVPNPSRWLDTVAGVLTFLHEMHTSPQQERVCLVTYSHFPWVDCTLTTNYNAIQYALSYYSAFFLPGATDIGGGISTATYQLTNGMNQRPWATKAIVVLTDGIHNTGSDPIAAAQAAADAGIVIFTVTFADEADQSRMQQVAAIGGGTHFHASNGAQLNQVFREIANRMPTLLSR